MDMSEIPLFPLKTVLLPANTLGLKIFETRYLDMIANCMRENSPFGVVLIHKGEETGTNTDVYSIGTTATISDWEHRADGSTCSNYSTTSAPRPVAFAAMTRVSVKCCIS